MGAIILVVVVTAVLDGVHPAPALVVGRLCLCCRRSCNSVVARRDRRSCRCSGGGQCQATAALEAVETETTANADAATTAATAESAPVALRRWAAGGTAHDKLMAEEAGCGCGCFGRWRECLSFRCTFY